MWLTISFKTFWASKCWTPRWNASISTFKDIFTTAPSLDGTNTPGRVFSVSHQHHLYRKLSFDFEIPLKLKLAMMITGGSTLLTKLLRVILIPLPRSTEQSTLAQSPSHFPTELPSVLQGLWYPACLLDLKTFRFQDTGEFSNLTHFILLSEFILRL